MAGNIKGITIEFRGDTTKLDKALRQVNQETRKIDQELRNVDKALKFNPTSVDLWRQKQTLLTQKISETREKLQLLKQQQAAMDAAGVDKQSLEYQKLQREIIETESKVKTLEGELRKIGNVSLKAASEQFKQWGTQLENAGRAMQGISMAAAAVATSIGALAVKSGAWADDLNTMSKRYSIGTGELQKYAAAADLVDVSVEAIAGSHIKLEKQMLAASKGTGASAEAFKKLGVDVTNADGSLRNGDAVWQDTIAALGKMQNETERDAYAMQLMGRSASELNPLIEDNGETYKNVADTFAKYGLDYIDQETLDKANEFNDQLDTMKAIGLITFQSLGAKLAEYLEPALEKVVDWVGRLAQWLSNLSPQTLTIIGIIATLVATIAPLLIVLGKLATGISSIINLANMLGIGFGALASPIGIAIAAIAAIIAIGVLLYKNWDTIKAKAVEIWNGIKNTISTVWEGIKSTIQHAIAVVVSTVVGKFQALKATMTTIFNAIKSTVTTIWNNIKTAITTPINAAKDAVKKAIDAVKKILSGTLSFPKIKLPHFSISGKFSLNPPSVPKFGVKWYDKGGIFSSPTVIGVAEKRPEFVGALDDLRKIVREESGGGGGNIVMNVYASPGMDVKQLAAVVEARLVAAQKRRERAYGGI